MTCPCETGQCEIDRPAEIQGGLRSVLTRDRRVTRLEALLDVLTQAMHFDNGDDLVEVQRMLAIAIDRRREDAKRITDLYVERMMALMDVEEVDE